MDTEKNKLAWDNLYKTSPGSVWGPDPIPFVEEFLGDLSHELSPSSHLLDAAAGDGRHIPALHKVSSKVTACDASRHSLEKLAQFNGGVSLHQCDLSETPFEDGTFDFISLIDTVETLPEPEPILKELRRILKPGGMLLCNIPGKDDEISAEGMQPAATDEPSAFLYQSTYFYRFYEEPEALDLLTRCGFEVLRNEIRHWEEEPHPGFRDYRHQHTSRVFLLRKGRG